MKHTDESGSFLIPLGVAILVLIGITFYSIDMALMFKGRNQLQAATDAGLTRALQLLSSNPNPTDEELENIILLSELEAWDNLKIHQERLKIDLDPEEDPLPVTITIELEPEIEVFAEGALTVNTWLYHLVPGYQNRGRLQSYAEGRKKKLVIAMLLDVSESMDERISQNECSEVCLLAANYGFFGRARLRDFGINGSFVFNPSLPEITPDFTGRGDFPPPPPGDGGDNSSDDDSGSGDDDSGSGDNGSEDRPTCTDLGLCRTPSKLEVMKSAARNFVSEFGTHIDRLYLIKFQDDAENLDIPTDIPGTEVVNLAITEIMALTADGGTNMADAVSLAETLIRSTYAEGEEWDDAFSAIILLTDGIPGTGEKESVDCIDLSDTYNYDKAPYMAKVINQTDELRLNPGVSIFSVGIGPESDVNEPYQDRFDGYFLKPFFMRRMSNDPAAFDDPQFEPGVHCVDFSLDAMLDRHHGVYLPSDGTDLDPIMNSFGEQILTRIVK